MAFSMKTTVPKSSHQWGSYSQQSLILKYSGNQNSGHMLTRDVDNYEHPQEKSLEEKERYINVL